MTITAAATRASCTGCNGAYTLRADGTMRAHRAAGRRCPGSLQPPMVEPPEPPPPASPTLTRALPPEVLACEHLWSGWTRLPRTTEDFRRCESCRHVELQQRQPCVLCGDQDARAFEVPGYGTAYVCEPCMQGLG